MGKKTARNGLKKRRLGIAKRGTRTALNKRAPSPGTRPTNSLRAYERGMHEAAAGSGEAGRRRERAHGHWTWVRCCNDATRLRALLLGRAGGCRRAALRERVVLTRRASPDGDRQQRHGQRKQREREPRTLQTHEQRQAIMEYPSSRTKQETGVIYNLSIGVP